MLSGPVLTWWLSSELFLIKSLMLFLALAVEEEVAEDEEVEAVEPELSEAAVVAISSRDETVRLSFLCIILSRR